ncbi:hypothetical protein [uncultured Lacinutrix sp.]|uniref:hypothetical protein n=1 Tax=uncultured Lacinutrix sp. TaxID=574032 RepID=UPI0026094FC3|nr:hypothetical protein [uncultured Lacinutrix sp.]
MKILIGLVLGLLIGILIMYFYCCKNNVGALPTQDPPRGLISTTEAKALNDNWTDYRKHVNDSVAFGGVDNRSSWYSIEDIKSYLSIVEGENNNITGIRFYLGVDDSLGKGGKTTIFMVPTVPNPDYKPGENDPNNDDPLAKGLDRAGGGMPPGQGYPN